MQSWIEVTNSKGLMQETEENFRKKILSDIQENFVSIKE